MNLPFYFEIEFCVEVGRKCNFQSLYYISQLNSSTFVSDTLHESQTYNIATFRAVTGKSLKDLWKKKNISETRELLSTSFCFSTQYLISVCLLCIHPWFWCLGFPLHAWLCHRMFISQHAGHSGSLLLSVWHHFLLDGSATRPRNLHRAPSLGEDCSHTNGYWCPVLIRNVSQCLTASVSHSLKRGRKYSTSCLPPSLRFSHSVSHSRAACSYLNCHS